MDRRSTCASVIMGLTLAGCAGGGAPDSQGAKTSSTAATGGTQVSTDPCTLVTQAEAQTAFGGSVKPLSGVETGTLPVLSGKPLNPMLKDHRVRQCIISPSDVGDGNLYLSLLTKTLSQDEFVAVYHVESSNTGGVTEVGDPIEGLGDGAFMSKHKDTENVQLWTIKAGTVVVLTGRPERAMRDLADIALGRI